LIDATSPTWIPVRKFPLKRTPYSLFKKDDGISFTSGSEYIELPGFIPSASDLTVSTSATFLFYLKMDSAPASGTSANIISYKLSSVIHISIFKSSNKIFIEFSCGHEP